MSTRSSWRPAIALFKVAKVHAAKLKMQRNKSLATIKGHKILSHTHSHTNNTHTRQYTHAAAGERHSYRRWKITSALGCKTAACAIRALRACRSDVEAGRKGRVGD